MTQRRVTIAADFILIFVIVAINLTFHIEKCQATAGIKLLERFRRKSINEGLYTMNDKITILTKSNFKSTVYNKPYAWLIEFYSSWCGHCKNFAPTWKEFALSVHEWHEIVSIGAIDCADDQNNDICRDMDILGYPTIKYFHQNYVEASGNVGRSLKRAHSERELINLLLSEMLQDQENNLNKSWPNLTLTNFSNAAEIWNNTPMNIDVVFLIFETAESTIGSEVIMDLYDIRNVKVLRVSNSSNLAKILSIKFFPSLYVVNKYSYKPHLLSVDTSRLLLKTVMIRYLHSEGINIPKRYQDILFTETTSSKSIINENVTIDDLKFKIRDTTVYQADLETGLRYTISHEITRLKTISGDALIALKNYLKILIKYFPFRANGKVFVTKLLENIESKDVEWQGKDIASLISNLEKEYSPVYSTVLDWIGCKGSTPNYRGFTCSLWMIFHTLTVSAANKNSVDPPEVLRVMLAYVKHFFGCTDCSEHFQKMAEQNKLDSVAENDGAITWLWIAHNEVNHRLAGDATEDPQHPKKQFPSSDDCPKCRDSRGYWDIKEVLIFLKNMYGENNTDLIRTLPQQSVSASSHFSNFDMAIMYLLYLYCIIIFYFIIRLFFSKRNYRKKSYAYDLFNKV